MKALAILMVTVLLCSPVSAAQRHLAAGEEIVAMQTLAAAIPLGSRVKLQLKSGRRLTGTLMAADANAIVVKRDARRPEPAVSIAYDELAGLRREDRSGFTLTKAIGTGLAAGAGAILTLFALAVVLDD